MSNRVTASGFSGNMVPLATVLGAASEWRLVGEDTAAPAVTPGRLLATSRGAALQERRNGIWDIREDKVRAT